MDEPQEDPRIAAYEYDRDDPETTTSSGADWNYPSGWSE